MGWLNTYAAIMFGYATATGAAAHDGGFVPIGVGFTLLFAANAFDGFTRGRGK